MWSAPGRVNLIGEHTDYNEGLVLPFAIAERTVAAAVRRDDDIIAAAPRSTRGPLPSGWPTSLRVPSPAGPAYPLGVAWALRKLRARPGAVGGVDLFIHSIVPAGAGVSSSAALEMAVAGALNALWELAASAPELARAGRGPRTRSSARPPGSWTSTPPCSASRARRCSSTAAPSRPGPCRCGWTGPASRWS